jgi:predicted DNA-binding ribbon-helix-helix protein
VKRSIVVAGHKTSVSLEEAFWHSMKEISGERNMTLSELVGEIDSKRQQGNLSSAISTPVSVRIKSIQGNVVSFASLGPGWSTLRNSIRKSASSLEAIKSALPSTAARKQTFSDRRFGPNADVIVSFCPVAATLFDGSEGA